MFTPDTLVIHCSATKDGSIVNWQGIRKYHVEVNGWADIGYHFGIENVGTSPECLVGRIPLVPGAHVSQHNSYTLGLCVVGNFDLYPPSETTWLFTVKICKWIVSQWKIGKVLGHRELFSGKTCPGVHFDMHLFREALRG